ncbi:armadillo-type protein [Umbelopsis sp. PMI_123]|nr:armadillo-type protein [Umbelopsis sp. PMI_123]
MDDLGDQEDLRKVSMASAFPSIPQKPSNMSYFKRPFDITPQLPLESTTSGRRPRADTMPSQSTAFPYTPTNLDINPTRPSPIVGSRQRSGSVTQSSPLGPSMLRSSWIDIDPTLGHPPSLQSPSSDILDEERSGTIASTMATLGLDDDKDMRPSDSVSSAAYHHASLQSRPNTMSADNLSPHHLLMNHTNTIRSRAYTTSAKPQLPTHPELFLPASQPSSSSRFQPFAPTSNRPRAISLGMADATIEGPTVTPNRDTVVNPTSFWPTDLTRQRGLRGSTSSGNLSNMASSHHEFGSADRFLPLRNELADQWTDELYHSNRLFESSGSTQPLSAQTPTRSLWFGNVDPALTVPELMQIFSPYGPIESARVLPDKECAFVNFVNLDDALRAKDDFGSSLASSLGGSFVKVGFGKPEVATAASSNTDMNNTVQGPTRALWIGNLPSSTTATMLRTVFSTFGVIESARILAHKNCGFVNFDSQDDAIRAKKALHNVEIMGPGTGAVRVGYAKVPTKSTNSSPSPVLENATLEESGQKSAWPASESGNQSNDAYQAQMLMVMLMAEMAGANSSALTANAIKERMKIFKELDGSAEDPIFEDRTPINYAASIPAVSETVTGRKLETSRLREMRKRLDSGNYSQDEIEAMGLECLPDVVELCSDHIGNTVIQKLYERCSNEIKDAMLEKVAPYLASIGVHKNGTWAAQKIIDKSTTDKQIALVCHHLAKYVPALFLDQFGNYVVQCCLPLGPERNQFIYDAIVDRCWEIAQGRFGARAVRATLESQYTTDWQRKYAAAAIVQNAPLLIINPNGVLLLNWLLDTLEMPGHFKVLLPQVLPHLRHLAVQKIASSVLYKMINQQEDLETQQAIIEAVCESMETILADTAQGVSFVQKIMTSVHVNQDGRQHVARIAHNALVKTKLQDTIQYRRLVEDIINTIGDEPFVDN